jgi:hypothetical protein
VEMSRAMSKVAEMYRVMTEESEELNEGNVPWLRISNMKH